LFLTFFGGPFGVFLSLHWALFYVWTLVSLMLKSDIERWIDGKTHGRAKHSLVASQHNTDLALKPQVVKSISKITPHQLSFPPHKVRAMEK
jgi:hypothetical protein